MPTPDSRGLHTAGSREVGRAGSTPTDGSHAANIRRGVEFVCGQIEESDSTSLFVTPLRGTRLQSKLGTYIDTFLASLMLSEVKDEMPDADSNARVAEALDKVMQKMARNQNENGTWGNQGWAPALAESLGFRLY